MTIPEIVLVKVHKGNLQLPTPPPMGLSTWVQFLVVQKIASPFQWISVSETIASSTE